MILMMFVVRWVMQIEGVYSIRPPLPAIGGNEGAFEVMQTGSEVRDFKPKDWVIPCNPGFGMPPLLDRSSAAVIPDLERFRNLAHICGG